MKTLKILIIASILLACNAFSQGIIYAGPSRSVYYVPPVTYVQPAPVVYQQPVVVQSAPVVVQQPSTVVVQEVNPIIQTIGIAASVGLDIWRTNQFYDHRGHYGPPPPPRYYNNGPHYYHGGHR